MKINNIWYPPSQLFIHMRTIPSIHSCAISLAHFSKGHCQTIFSNSSTISWMSFSNASIDSCRELQYSCEAELILTKAMLTLQHCIIAVFPQVCLLEFLLICLAETSVPPAHSSLDFSWSLSKSQLPPSSCQVRQHF